MPSRDEIMSQLTEFGKYADGWCDEDPNSLSVSALVPIVRRLIDQMPTSLTDDIRIYADAPHSITMDWHDGKLQCTIDENGPYYVTCFDQTDIVRVRQCEIDAADPSDVVDRLLRYKKTMRLYK